MKILITVTDNDIVTMYIVLCVWMKCICVCLFVYFKDQIVLH